MPLDYKSADALYKVIATKAAERSDAAFQSFYKKFLEQAVEYANKRSAWCFMSQAQRLENDRNRSIIHDSYMAALSAVCRNLGVENIDTLLPDRKTKGDFACYVALFLSLEQR